MGLEKHKCLPPAKDSNVNVLFILHWKDPQLVNTSKTITIEKY